jgi:hypothetical protein
MWSGGGGSDLRRGQGGFRLGIDPTDFGITATGHAAGGNDNYGEEKPRQRYDSRD